MDARLRNLFVSRRGQKLDQHQLRAHPYESTEKQLSPITGTRPIAGNGPYRLENVALQAYGRGAAEPPSVSRSRPESYSRRPQTAPQPAQWQRFRRNRSNFSTETLMDSSRYTSPYHPAPTTTQRGRSFSALPTHAVRVRNHSAHIDILDAVTQINPSPHTFIQKRIASGKRDYGEDVADRNISEYGGVEFPPHDEYSNSDDDAMQSQDGPTQVENEWEDSHWPEQRPEINSRDGSKRDSYVENDEVGDDTASQKQRTRYDTSQINFHANQRLTGSAPAAPNTHARRQYGNPITYNADGMRETSRPGWSSSAPADAALSVIPAPLSNAGSSTNSYRTSASSKNTASTNRESWETAKTSRKSLQSRGTQTTPPPQSTASSQFSDKVSSKQEIEDLDLDWYKQSPTRSRLSRRVILPTPPMSPTNGGSPTTSIPRASLDKELPPPPSSGNPKSTPVRKSQGSPIRSSALPPHEFGRSPERVRFETNRAFETSGSSQQHNDKTLKLNSLKSSSSVRQRLEDVIDTSNTTDTEVIKTQSPAIVHEYVTPEVRYINERRISREIHNQNVFHRIQPIIDVEVLPTKHYIPTTDGKGLIEIPDTQLPGRHTNWTVQPTEDKLGNTASTVLESNTKSLAKSREYLSPREPRVQDSQKNLTNDGTLREETVWRHPPQLENGARETGQTVPLHIKHYGDENLDELNDTASERYAPSDPYAGSEKTFSTNADGEEELLYRDSDYAFDGRLPGLEEANPVVDGGLSPSRPSTATTRKADVTGQGEATSALRRMRESKLASKMGQLSIADE